MQPGWPWQKCSSDVSVTNGALYHYSAFVFDKGGNFSLARSVSAGPFDPVVELPEWFYATGATTLAPTGIRPPSSFIVSNDHFLHSMTGGVTSTSGLWPTGGSPPWMPYRLGAPAQHRPSVVPISGEPVAILGALDGRVYAVHAQSGRIVWKSQVLGGQILAPPAAMVAAFGATGGAADKVYVGTGDALSNSLAILDLHTGALLGRFDDAGCLRTSAPSRASR